MKKNKVIVDILNSDKRTRVFKDDIAKSGAYNLGKVVRETTLPNTAEELRFLASKRFKK